MVRDVVGIMAARWAACSNEQALEQKRLVGGFSACVTLAPPHVYNLDQYCDELLSSSSLAAVVAADADDAAALHHASCNSPV
jgi:hypothetical protein